MYDRKLIVRELRLEGAIAAAEGKSAQSYPHKHMDAFQWLAGFSGEWGTVEDCQADLEKYRERKRHRRQRNIEEKERNR